MNECNCQKVTIHDTKFGHSSVLSSSNVNSLGSFPPFIPALKPQECPNDGPLIATFQLQLFMINQSSIKPCLIVLCSNVRMPFSHLLSLNVTVINRCGRFRLLPANMSYFL